MDIERKYREWLSSSRVNEEDKKTLLAMGEEEKSDAKSVSIYNMAGQAIVLNSGEMTFNVASGYYIVVVDGKTTKVMVR